MTRIALKLIALLAALAPAAEAQQVRSAGRVDHPAARRFEELLARGNYLVVARDTVIPEASTIAGDVVVIGADLRLSGAVAGSVAVIGGGDLFLRPSGRVLGSVISIGGGLYLSENAPVGERLELPAEVHARVERRAGAYAVELTAPPSPGLVQPAGIFGLGLPAYDRVNGVTLRVGVNARLSADSAAPQAHAALLYHSARATLGGIVGVEAPLASRWIAGLELSRRTRTNDAWMRGDLTNTATALFARSDMRNYFESDAAELRVRRAMPTSPEGGRVLFAPRAVLALSRDRSLPARDVWSLFGDEPWRVNPEIDEGTVASAGLGTLIGWQGMTTRFTGDLSAEWAPGVLGDFQFGVATADGTWDMQALWGHTIRVRGHTVVPLAGSRPPAQRWAALGGATTLPTLDAGAMRGDHLVFVESTYSIPLQLVTLPVVGSPSLFVQQAVGSAWLSETPAPRWRQNLGAGLAFSLVQVTVHVDPTRPGRPVLGASATLPQ